MLRTRRLSSSACLLAGLAVLVAAGPGLSVLPAAADTTEGTLTVVVDRDVDDNGNFSADIDTPQPGIGIAVSDSAGHTVQGVTDQDGRFKLVAGDKLGGGRYFVVAEIPANLRELSPVPQGSDFQAMSTTVDVTSQDQSVRMGVALRAAPLGELGGKPATGQPAPAERAPAPRFAVGDLVWRDTDRSGQQVAGEPGASQVSVQLLNSDGDVVESTVTTGSGHYLFDRLPEGTYSVRFAGVTSGYRLATAGRGSDRGRDSDPDYTGVTPPFTLGVGEPNVRPAAAADHVEAAYINPTIDAGITAIRYAVADQVWLDANRDGTRQADELGAAAAVTLLSGQRTVVATTTTDAQGHYQFTGLLPGRYRLRFSGLPAHRGLTQAHAGADPAADSDPDPVTGVTSTFRLGPSAPDLVPAADVGVAEADLANATTSAGLVGVYSLGDTVWRDNNGDGVLDDGDGAVKGVTVELLDHDRQLLASKVTNSNGRFTFDELPAGGYQLHFTKLPSGLVFVPSQVGANSAVDSDADPSGLTPVVTLGDENPADTTVDAGITTPANLQISAGAAGIAAPAETALSQTGGVAVAIPAGGLALVLCGGVCLLIGRRRARTRRPR